MLAYEVILMNAEIRTFRKANETLSKCRRAKKSRIREGGALSVQDGCDIILQTEVDNQIRRDECFKRGSSNGEQSTLRRCGSCGKSGHNVRTCQEDLEDSSLSDSE
ncbi:hypothetical protein SBOR_9249 [Sclerotinia borealis F-4128]|uniref:CCHC-type domain-containing protein n=1 Tax=Sclerotinia borealis (strain F-4128) TaxID=1432307 RepID=W9C0P8_SCLBF|nr:hypothetical protein SBOR_9249 [Sclerotinia borealis F-4128]